jgi:hypothetical protein
MSTTKTQNHVAPSPDDIPPPLSTCRPFMVGRLVVVTGSAVPLGSSIARVRMVLSKFSPVSNLFLVGSFPIPASWFAGVLDLGSTRGITSVRSGSHRLTREALRVSSRRRVEQPRDRGLLVHQPCLRQGWRRQMVDPLGHARLTNALTLAIGRGRFLWSKDSES